MPRVRGDFRRAAESSVSVAAPDIRRIEVKLAGSIVPSSSRAIRQRIEFDAKPMSARAANSGRAASLFTESDYRMTMDYALLRRPDCLFFSVA